MKKNEPHPDLERRSFTVASLRADNAGDGKPTIAGHAAVFDAPSVNLGGFREIVAPGAFTESLKGDDVLALFNHNRDIVLGRNTAGTLRLAEDKTGLAFEIDPPDTQAARDLITSIRRGDISGMSFGFRTIEDRWETKAGVEWRTLMKVTLLDISLATTPAYPETDVAVRSRDDWKKQQSAAAEAAASAAAASRRRAIDLIDREV